MANVEANVVANVEANIMNHNLWPMLCWGQCCGNVVAILWPIFQTACFSSPSIPWLMTWFVYCFPLFAFIPISQHFFYATLILHSGFSKDHVIMKNISICLCWKKKSFDPVSFKFWSADMFFQHCVEQTINIFWGQKKVKHSNKIGLQLKYIILSHNGHVNLLLLW